MPQRQNSNRKLPGSSSSLSLNESPASEDYNYDSDISEDDHAIAEDGDDEEDDGDYVDVGDEDEGEEFQVEINTLTGNTFSVTIHPSDTLEVLKTRIAFQEGISPAEQNILLEQGKLLEPTRASDTIEELNIDRHSKLTLVTNLSSGTGAVSCKSVPGLEDDDNDNSFSPPPGVHNLAPTIKRNYHSHNFSTLVHHQPSSNSSNGSLRLPKILSLHETNGDSSNDGGSAKHINHNHNSSTVPRLDERVWMKSLFDKIVQDDENADEVIDIDSTRTTATAASNPMEEVTRPVRYEINGKLAQRPEDDGSILIVQGEDGVILIIQKNTGELSENSFTGNNNNNPEGGRANGTGFELEFRSGRIPASATMGRNRKYQSLKVHEKIKENAVTLEKMKQVRGMLAQKQLKREESLPPRPPAPLNRLEFPKIRERTGTATTTGTGSLSSSYSGNRNWGRDSENVEYAPEETIRSKKSGLRGSTSTLTTPAHSVNSGATRARSLNSSKTSLNRLVAEIYLQSRRKRRAFQPGQPPYTEQQLVRYVQLKIAILLEEQRKNKTEPCSKCQMHGEWLQDKSSSSSTSSSPPPYLVPTVVMDRFKRLGNAKKWKSLEEERDPKQEGGDVRPVEFTFRRKSLIPITSSSSISSYKSIIGEIHIPGIGSGGSTSTNNNPNNLIKPSVKPLFGGANNNTSKLMSRKPLYSSSSSNNGQVSSSNFTNFARAPSLKLHRQKMQSSTDISTTGGKVGASTNATTLVNGMRRAQSLSRPGTSSKPATAKKGSAVRCHSCKKKIGISWRYQCRCGLTFCSTHRYPETHACTFDYKTEGRNKIREANPVIVAQKIQEI